MIVAFFKLIIGQPALGLGICFLVIAAVGAVSVLVEREHG